jgi:hypothetical protein
MVLTDLWSAKLKLSRIVVSKTEFKSHGGQ